MATNNFFDILTKLVEEPCTFNLSTAKNISITEMEQLQLLQNKLQEKCISPSFLESTITNFTDIVLKYAQHNYTQQTSFIETNDLLNSLGQAINMLGEEMVNKVILIAAGSRSHFF